MLTVILKGITHMDPVVTEFQKALRSRSGTALEMVRAVRDTTSDPSVWRDADDYLAGRF